MRISDWSSDVVLCRSQSGTPSPLPQRRLERASHMLEAGRPAAALAEVTRMPGRAAGSKWMEQARRYIEARRALDLIRSEEHTSDSVTNAHLVCRLLLEKKKQKN